jgi:hypothetical protein
LWKNGKEKSWLVARLIGITFLGNPKEGDTINHKDGNRYNNNLENLEWLSRADNIRHAFETNLMSTQKKIILISDNYKQEFRSMSLASKYIGRNNGYISLCLKNNRNAIGVNGNRYNIYVA